MPNLSILDQGLKKLLFHNFNHLKLLFLALDHVLHLDRAVEVNPAQIQTLQNEIIQKKMQRRKLKSDQIQKKRTLTRRSMKTMKNMTIESENAQSALMTGKIQLI